MIELVGIERTRALQARETGGGRTGTPQLAVPDQRFAAVGTDNFTALVELLGIDRTGARRASELHLVNESTSGGRAREPLDDHQSLYLDTVLDRMSRLVDPAIVQVEAISQLGRYEILRHIATGGMAEVYLARTSGLQGFARHVVVKRIRAEFVRDPRFVRMFLDEARLAATLHHHHVVQVYDVGQDGSEYFFAMEYVHGEDLRHILSASSKRRELIRLDYALAIIQAAAAGLDYAHNQCDSDGRPLGIVHRDVSPSNILVGYDGSVKLVDFGIAKATSRPGETQVGVLKGKISYLSPEQLRSAGVDRRSDVFSLGIVLFELSTTKRLFRGASEFETMHRILTGDVPRPSAVIPGYPSELEQIVLRALSVDPGERQQSAGELASELDAFAHRARLAVSSSALGRWITELFGKRPEPWTVATRSPANTEEAWTILDGTVSDADGGAMDLAPATAATPVPSAPGPPAPAIVTGPILRPMLDDSPVQTPPARARPDTTRHSTLQRMRPRSRRSGQLPMIIALVVTGLALVGGAMFLQQRAPRAPTPTARPSP